MLVSDEKKIDDLNEFNTTSIKNTTITNNNNNNNNNDLIGLNF